MPAIQSKITVDNKHPAEEENVKAKGHLKTKNKDRSSFRKPDPGFERAIHMRRKKNIVPDLDLKPGTPLHVLKKTNLKDDSTRRAKRLDTPSPRHTPTVKTVLKPPRPNDFIELYSRTDMNALQDKLKGERDSFFDEMRSSQSLFFFSPRQVPNNSLINVENVDPNQSSEKFYECNELDDFFRNQFPDFENTTELDFQAPKVFEDFELPCLPSKSSSSSNGPGVLKHFKELLLQEENSRTNLLGQDEIALLKDIVKADERHQRLRRDDYNLLKEILTGQLKEITQQERVIKIALKKIRSRTDDEVEVTTMKVHAAEQPMEDVSPKSRSHKSTSARSHSSRSKAETPKQEVDIIFKNVPSLEKEIRILRSLGLKLEETLKKSSGRKTSARDYGRPSFYILTVYYKYYRHSMGEACYKVNAMGLRVIRCVAQEYQIRHQTIDELKLEREFFISSDLVDRRFSLERTNFYKLSRNPEMLLRRLKPIANGDQTKFNFIEQNPIFFNHFLAKMCKICSDPIDGHSTYIPQSSAERLLSVKSGAGDHSDFPPLKEVERLQLPFFAEAPPSPPSNTINKRRKKKRTFTNTALLNENRVPPKNSLVRAIIVGTIQLSIIFTVVTAIMYPDLICF